MSVIFIALFVYDSMSVFGQGFDVAHDSLFYSKKFRLIPRCSASPKIASCRTLSPAAVQLRKLVAGGEIPNTAHACIAVIYSRNKETAEMILV